MTSVKIGLFTCEKNISIVHTVIDQEGAERVLVIDFIIFMQKYFGHLKTIRTYLEKNFRTIEVILPFNYR